MARCRAQILSGACIMTNRRLTYQPMADGQAGDRGPVEWRFFPTHCQQTSASRRRFVHALGSCDDAAAAAHGMMFAPIAHSASSAALEQSETLDKGKAPEGNPCAGPRELATSCERWVRHYRGSRVVQGANRWEGLQLRGCPGERSPMPRLIVCSLQLPINSKRERQGQKECGIVAALHVSCSLVPALAPWHPM